MKILRGFQTAVLAILCVLGTASVVVEIASFAFDLKASSVLSGSMEPTLPVGSLVFTQTVDAAEIAVGDIVTVTEHGGEGVVTHRVVAIEPADAGRVSLTLRGDANMIDDVAPYTVRTVDKYRFQLPYVGTAILWAKDHRLPAALGLLSLLAFTFIGRTRLTVKLPNGELVRGLSRRDAERLIKAWDSGQGQAAKAGADEAPKAGADDVAKAPEAEAEAADADTVETVVPRSVAQSASHADADTAETAIPRSDAQPGSHAAAAESADAQSPAPAAGHPRRAWPDDERQVTTTLSGAEDLFDLDNLFRPDRDSGDLEPALN
jgi:signal peptidase I